jgi:hypothetical protein
MLTRPSLACQCDHAAVGREEAEGPQHRWSNSFFTLRCRPFFSPAVANGAFLQQRVDGFLWPFFCKNISEVCCYYVNHVLSPFYRRGDLGASSFLRHSCFVIFLTSDLRSLTCCQRTPPIISGLTSLARRSRDVGGCPLSSINVL